MLLLTHDPILWAPDPPGWPDYCWWAVCAYRGPATIRTKGDQTIWERPVTVIGFVLGRGWIKPIGG